MSYAKTYKFVELAVDGIAADTGYQVIDLSDTTNFPHGRTDRLIVKAIQFDGTISDTGGGEFVVYVGVVTECDSTDGSMTALRKWDVKPIGGAHTYHEQQWPFAGVDCKVVSGALQFFAGNSTVADNAAWKNDAGIQNINGTAAGNPGVGDLVAYVDEVVNGSTLRLRIGVAYDTEDAR